MKSKLTRYEMTSVFRALQIGLNTDSRPPLSLDKTEEEAATSGGAKLAEFIFSDTMHVSDEDPTEIYERIMDNISLSSMNGDEEAVIRARDVVRKLRDNA